MQKSVKIDIKLVSAVLMSFIGMSSGILVPLLILYYADLDTLGKYFIYASFVSLATNPISQGLIRVLQSERSLLTDNCFWLFTCLGGVIWCLLCIAISTLICWSFDLNFLFLMIFVLTIGFSLFNNILAAFMEVHGDIDVAQFSLRSGKIILFPLFLVLLQFLSPSTVSLLTLMIVDCIVSLVILMITLSFFWFKKKLGLNFVSRSGDFAKYLKKVGRLSFLPFLNWSNSSVDIYLISFFFSTELLGIYKILQLFPRVITLVADVLGRRYIPKLVTLLRFNDIKESLKLMTTFYSYYFVFGAFFFIGLYVFLEFSFYELVDLKFSLDSFEFIIYLTTILTFLTLNFGLLTSIFLALSKEFEFVILNAFCVVILTVTISTCAFFANSNAVLVCWSFSNLLMTITIWFYAKFFLRYDLSLITALKSLFMEKIQFKYLEK